MIVRAPILVLVCAISVVLGTGPAVADAPASGAPTPTLSSPTLMLVTPGKGPRTVLRLTPPKGAKATASWTMQSASARGAPGRLPPPEPGPTVALDVEVEVTGVTADGDVEMHYRYGDATITATKRTPKAQVDETTAQYGKVRGVEGTTVVTNRGLPRSSNMTAAPNATKEDQQLLAATQKTLEQVAVPFPEEPVGIGARWTSRSRVTAGELTIDTTATFTLRERSAAGARLEVSISASGRGGGPGTLTLKASGKGDVVLDLMRPITASATITMRTEVLLVADGFRGAQVGTSTMKMTSR